MLTRDEAVARLNLSPRSIEILVEDGILLELRGTGERLYPEEQFSGSGIDGELASFLGFFRRLKLDGDQVWSWLNGPLEELDGLTPLRALRLADSDETLEELRFLAQTSWEIEAYADPSLERTDWLRTASSSEDENGIGDYTPTRRGGQHAS